MVTSTILLIVAIIISIVVAKAIIQYITILKVGGGKHSTLPAERNVGIVVRDNLDHDICVSGLGFVCDKVYTGIQPWVGPSPASWPVGFPQKWEVGLFEDGDHYYARLIYHEYVLWMSFDYPYLLVKMKKSKVGDLRDESVRNKLLWNITYQRLHQYDDYKDCGFDNAVLKNINGHNVVLAPFYNCNYKDYVVICDEDDMW